MRSYQGRTALITGASAGIGEVFARKFASLGANVVLVARSEEKLQRLAADLTSRYSIKATVVALDLSSAGAPEALLQRTRSEGIAVDILVNNAGFATHGYFDQLPLARQHEEVTLNVSAVVDLCHLYIAGMIARGDGLIINVASTASFQPLPYMAVYGATKAFVLSFSEALWAENRSRGVQVLALCPGATDTGFFEIVGAEEASVGKRASPEAVVDVALKAVERGQSSVIEGGMNKLLAALPRFLPRQTVLQIVTRTFQPKRA